MAVLNVHILDDVCRGPKCESKPLVCYLGGPLCWELCLGVSVHVALPKGQRKEKESKNSQRMRQTDKARERERERKLERRKEGKKNK